MRELWMNIVGYVGEYQVSSLGRVRSVDRIISTGVLRHDRILSLRYRRNGYVDVMLHHAGNVQRIYVHKLVATAFLPNPEDLKEVNHKDESKHNNQVSNLEWCSRQYNNRYKGLQHKRKSSNPIKAKGIVNDKSFEFDSARRATSFF